MRKGGAVRGEPGGNEGMKVLPRPLLRCSEPIAGTRRAHLPGGHFPSNRCQSSSEVEVPPLSEQLPVSELLAEGEPTVLEAEDVELLVVYELRASLVDEVCHDVAQVFGPKAPSSVGEVLNGFVVVVVHGSVNRAHVFRMPRTGVMRSGEAKNTASAPLGDNFSGIVQAQ